MKTKRVIPCGANSAASDLFAYFLKGGVQGSIKNGASNAYRSYAVEWALPELRKF